MSHQRFPSRDAGREPHSISLKVLRLSRPSLVPQHPLRPALSPAVPGQADPFPASLAYSPEGATNPDPFVLSPILNLPPSFGSAYVGETFSCTLCANHDAQEAPAYPVKAPVQSRTIRDVRIEAEMKTPSSAGVVKLDLSPRSGGDAGGHGGAAKGVDLDPGQTLQKVVNFDLKEEGNHVLAVTVSYYEATDTSGRTRTFRKLYQFICKSSLVVRTKAGTLPPLKDGGRRRWVLEAQLENCSEDVMQLERVGLDLEPGLVYSDCNWEATSSQKPVLHPGEVEQVCFTVQEQGQGIREADERLVFGVLSIGWRGEMGNRGFLSTGKLGTRLAR
ncbi:uncharacterized protein E0L32_004766 [Thyridium curvatum]|uniref:Trafficking protein particle complex subunit 13 n=1 Tax=Thyridium curvatum TaxID=1093900 RepID=A0A507BEK7_9PEZI|nr:uncharacterized protein E0L32_004766 [Thyridium curvatum]TPX15208.1 hypothetical protein E0L32_004766 [Thyridium curvatum]